MSSPKIYIAGMLMFFLCGCGLFQPYIDRRRNPGVSNVNQLYSGPSKPERPVICYNPLLTNDDDLQQMADDECIKHKTGVKAKFVTKKYFNGKLLLPNHAYYICVQENSEGTVTSEEISHIEEVTEIENYEDKQEEKYDEFTFGE